MMIRIGRFDTEEKASNSSGDSAMPPEANWGNDSQTSNSWKRFLVLTYLFLLPFFLFVAIQNYLFFHDEIAFYVFDFSPNAAKLIRYDFMKTKFFLFLFAANFIILLLDIFIYFVGLGKNEWNRRNRRLMRIGILLSILMFCYPVFLAMDSCSRLFNKKVERLHSFEEMANLYSQITFRFPSFQQALYKAKSSRHLDSEFEEVGEDITKEEFMEIIRHLKWERNDVLERYTIYFENMNSSDLNIPLFVENETESGHYYPEFDQFYRYGISLNGFLILYPYNQATHTYSTNGEIVKFLYISPDGASFHDWSKLDKQRD